VWTNLIHRRIEERAAKPRKLDTSRNPLMAADEVSAGLVAV